MSTNLLATARDEKALELLRQHVATGEVVAFVGAGMSARAGFNDWEGLLQDIAVSGNGKLRQRRAPVMSADLKDFSWRAEELRERVPHHHYYRLLERFFRRQGKDDDAVTAFARLKFRHIFTTNYDLSLEHAIRTTTKRAVTAINWLDRDAPREVMQSFGGGGTRPVLIYLHGRCDRPESIILSERDYRAQYVRSDETVRKLFAVFSMKRVVFFGFSLTDLDILSIFRQVVASTEECRHFALLADQGEEGRELRRARYAKKFGISPIFYQPGGDGHPNYGKVLELLGGRPRKGRPVSRGKTYRGNRWISTETYRSGGGKVDREDFQKGRFGGAAVCNGRRMHATVTADDDADDWFEVRVVVEAVGSKPLKGTVVFWLHPTFSAERYSIRVHRGRATFTFYAYGAFTVGATADGGYTPLELDLARVPGAPEAFRLA